ncbi:diguanylate cyclase domain-containing protein [Aeromonas enteropelogenes]|uniref:GGDEF domain-containing protein n=1 Tax=Aeromonas enteropelogenes TaxID=29489 RepID=UPI003B9F3B0E
MSLAPPCKRYYLLVPMTLLLGGLVLITTLILGVQGLLRDIDRTIASYGRIAASIEATLIHEMIQVSERQITVLDDSLDREAIARGESALNPYWTIAHRIQPDDHFIYFYNLRHDRIDTYPAWERPPQFKATERPWYAAVTQVGEEPLWLGPYLEYDTRVQTLTLVKRVMDKEDRLLGLLMVDMQFASLQRALQNSLGDEQAVAIYLTPAGGDDVIVASNLDLLARRGEKPEGIWSWPGFGVLGNGVHLTHPLQDIGWDLHIYLSAPLFRAILGEDLRMLVLPQLLLAVIWLLSLLVLVRIFRLEQRLVAGSLSEISRDVKSGRRFLGHKTWFVDDSLSKVDLVRANLLRGQDALHHDPLTGVMNRRAFDARQQTLLKEGQPHWLLLLDVDFFKNINDTHGHACGDQVLRRIAALLAEQLGEGNVYRFGGDEFAALLTMERADLEGRLRQLFIRVRNQQWREKRIAVTLSAGGAHYPEVHHNLFERADEYLYQSKRLGRDRWSLPAQLQNEQSNAGSADKFCPSDDG